MDIDGAPQSVDSNVLKTPNEADEFPAESPAVWPLLSGLANPASYHPFAGRQVVVQEGPWKLVGTFGKTISYKLFNTADDPQEKTDLATRLDHIAFRLRGLLEKQEALEFQAMMRDTAPGPRAPKAKK